MNDFRFIDAREPLPAGALVLDNTADVLARAGEVRRHAAVVLRFPKWTDGRAYSQAVLLRGRLRYAGEIVATGEVLADMPPLLRRCGFTAVQLRADQKLESAQRALGFVDTHYQTVPSEHSARARTGRRAIELNARATAGFEGRVAHAVAVLQGAASEHLGRIVQTTSLGAEDMVVTDLIARHGLPIALATLDTGRLHAQTLALIPRIEARYGLKVECWRPPAEQVVRFVASHGELAMRQSIELRKACCQLRKLEPLARALQGRSAWVTGLRREQSGARGTVPFNERDDQGRSKLNPLADWSWADVWHYIEQYDVPYNPLHDQFFPSIGCEPCTRAVAQGEDFRAGRWWWEDEAAKECGLHVKPHAAAAPAAGAERSEAPGGLGSAQAHVGAADVSRSQDDNGQTHSKEATA